MTLLELLSVVVIIGILASIALPAVFRQKEKAYRAAMRSDLSAIVKAQLAWSTANAGYTDELSALGAEGYEPTAQVTAHVAVAGDAFVACTRHGSVPQWLVYDSATQQTTSSSTDCA